MGIGLLTVGWAIGGGAAQILFALFGEQVFHRGAEGIGTIWGFAGHRPVDRRGHWRTGLAGLPVSRNTSTP